MRFLIDENLPFSLIQFLRNSHDVFDVAASHLRSANDKEIWFYAGQQQRILVTRDLDFPLAGNQPAPLGVILLRVPENFTAPQITNLFSQVIKDAALPSFEGHITVIAPGRVRTRPLL